MAEISDTTEQKSVSGTGTNSHPGAKSDSLQALRGLAFVGIFLGHFYYFGWTPISVSVFFILSGFLLTTRKNASYEKYGIADSFREAVRRISKLYPLHIIMMLVSIPFVIYRAGGLHLSDLLIKIGCNVLLIQSLVPSADINASLNGVLSLVFTLIVLIAVQTLYVYFVGCFVHTADVMTYLIHSSPLYRVFDMSYGIILGFMSMKERKPDEDSKLLSTIVELIALIVTGMLVFIWSKESMIVYLSYAPVCPLMSVIWMQLFYKKGGLATKLLTNKVTVFLGDRSGSAFLIHFPIVVYINTFIFPHLTVLKRTIIHGILFPGSVILTLVLSYLYDKWQAGRRAKNDVVKGRF